MRILVAVFLSMVSCFGPASAQVFPPGTFQVDGIPVNCGPVAFVLTTQIADVGMANGQGQIFLNPAVLSSFPTVLKLFWVAHECGHYMVGANEVAADCWAIRTGKQQGWFPPAAFYPMFQAMQNNPGDLVHPAGPQRFALMQQCYQSS